MRETGWAVSCFAFFFSPFSRSRFSFVRCHALLGSGADWAPEGGLGDQTVGRVGAVISPTAMKVRWGIMRFVSFCEVLLCVCETYYAFSEGRMEGREGMRSLGEGMGRAVGPFWGVFKDGGGEGSAVGWLPVCTGRTVAGLKRRVGMHGALSWTA